MVSRKNLRILLAALPVLLAMGCLLLSPARYGGCISEGISLWAVCVLPATLPFFFLTALLTHLKLYDKLSARLSPLFARLFGVSGAGGCAALLSALSGYPVGARTVLGLYQSGRVGKSECFRVACLASTTGPMFMVGVVGSGMLLSPAAGWVMLLCHYAAVWGVCLAMRLLSKPTALSAPPVRGKTGEGNALSDSLYNAVISSLCVGAAIALFYAFSQMAIDLLPAMPPFLEDLIRGLMEMTAGCKGFSAVPSPLAMAMCCSLVTFGGACVLMQQLAFLAPTGVKALPFLGVKLLQGTIAGVLCFALARLIF